MFVLKKYLNYKHYINPILLRVLFNKNEILQLNICYSSTSELVGGYFLSSGIQNRKKDFFIIIALQNTF